MSIFKKAQKSQSYLRCAMFGTSGSGKTYSALRLATGMAGDKGKIAFIDTENSASLYADQFEFDIVDASLACGTEQIIHYLKAAASEGYNVIVIDSLTHAWQDLLQQVEKIKVQFNNNKWSAWSKATPMQDNMIRAMQLFPGHIIATMRQKTEWTTEQDEKGKNKPVRIGTNPEQRSGVEYEFSMLFQVFPDHKAMVVKDRTGKYQDQIIDLIDEGLGQELVKWLQEGDLPPEVDNELYQKPASQDAIGKLHGCIDTYLEFIEMGDELNAHDIVHYIATKKYKLESSKHMSDNQIEALIKTINHAIAENGSDRKKMYNLMAEITKETK